MKNLLKSINKFFTRFNTKNISTDKAPAAIGPYSQAVKAGDILFCSGQIPLNAKGELVKGSADVQTKQCMENLKAVLKAANVGFSHVVKTTIFLANMNDFGAVNEVYGSYFSDDHKPARATVEVSRLPKDVAVEIECVAYLG
jgi:2-iminobutanoate/2-iminopropanoate deaminase